MIKNYFKTAWRNLIKNKLHSFVNISGLSAGISVAMLIGLWMTDELSFNENHKQYSRIAQVMQNVSLNGQVQTWSSVPYPLGDELRKSYLNDFTYVVLSSQTESHILINGEKKFTKEGNFMEPLGPELLSLKILHGTANLENTNSILLSQSLAKTFFGTTDPLDKIIKIDDNDQDVKVTGVYEDIPENSTFSGVKYIAPWELKLNFDKWIKEMKNPWGTSAFQVFVQLADKADLSKVSAKIRNIEFDKIDQEKATNKPQFFLQPMAKWHLYAEFKNGINVGGRIQYVWMFAIISVFVLLLACINFMNLNTARSEKRSREVGVRKVMGSSRRQLIVQFFSESLLTAIFAFFFSLLLVQLALPFFSEVADKKMSVPWSNPFFWLLGIGFSIFTGFIAGSYPAVYLSSFQPVKVLKGIFSAASTLPRKFLVVVQFTTSIILIIGTIVVFKQIQFAKNRPIGYNRDGLVMIHLILPGIHSHFDAVKNELKNSHAIEEIAESESPLTAIWRTYGDFDWKGRDPAIPLDLPNTGVSQEFGKTVGWQFINGRDFSKEYPADDSSSFVLNESAVKYMGLKDPVGEIIEWKGKPFKVIGVIKDMIIESPYAPVRPSVFCMAKSHENFAIIKINPAISASDALGKIQATFKKYSPALPFEYKFMDSEYAKKFDDEERVSKLASIFTVLAIFISCLGLFGMASFLAERRTKEVGVRKVLGASVFSVWILISKEFVILVTISLLIAMPAGYYFTYRWLENYYYRTELSWWIFAGAGCGALLVTLLTVSFQTMKAAVANPVKSLRTE